MTSRTPSLDLESTTENPEAAPAGRRLVAVWNGGSQVFPLPGRGTLVIGRGTDAGIQIEHASVSRRHAMLVLDDERIRLDDLGSSNGTLVNGQRIESRAQVPLTSGALVEVGSVLLVVQDVQTSTSSSDARLAAAPGPTSLAGVVVADPQMHQLYQRLEIIAKSSLSVIILGETGSGKEVFATRIHELSPRARGPFLKVNCAALVESLLEAELFGYERGAFTGATQAKAGILESAHGGTLFLDELGETPLSTQAKLLRVLESGEVLRVGAVKARPIDVRFVSATNRSLRNLVTEGKFRQDLFFRLDGISIALPPLRERPTEIAELSRAFLDAASRAAGRPPMTLSSAALAALHTYPWPGNVRELRNVIARSALLCPSSVLDAPDLQFEGFGPGAVSPPPPMSPNQAGLASVAPPALVPGDSPEQALERRRINEALERSVGNQTRAAKLLGISRRTLLKRLDALGFPRPRKTDADED